MDCVVDCAVDCVVDCVVNCCCWLDCTGAAVEVDVLVDVDVVVEVLVVVEVDGKKTACCNPAMNSPESTAVSELLSRALKAYKAFGFWIGGFQNDVPLMKSF